ncbi:MAG: hypothetical protein GX107_03465 [Clostridiales bacterium]|jgi:hypothetical protein|nr:hypothetical protein [Clostridiales bacterium]
MENKTLEELSLEYYEGAEFQKQLIEKNRLKLSAARKSGDKTEELRLTKLITVLYSQRRELLDTAAKLKHYYKFSGVSIK